MVSILGYNLGVKIPSFVSGSSIGTTITYILIAFLFFVLIGVLVYMYLNNRTYNRRIQVFENIAGQGYQPTFKDRARLVKIGDGGEEVLYLKKLKTYRTAYGKKMGKNVYWFAIGQDGYWYNILLGDLDAKMGMLDIEPVDRDMRYMHVAIRKNITERYRKISFMEKYGTMLMNGIFLIILLVGMWFIVKNVGDLVTEGTRTVESAKLLIDPISQALSKVDAICSGGSGITPV